MQLVIRKYDEFAFIHNESIWFEHELNKDLDESDQLDIAVILINPFIIKKSVQIMNIL